LIFDTSVVLKILKDREFLKLIKSSVNDEIKISTVSVYELLRGAMYMKIAYHSEKELNVIFGLISDVSIIPLGKEDAKIASYIWARLKERGATLSDADILIASACIANNEKLLTLDMDFNKIRDVYEKFEFEILR